MFLAKARFVIRGGMLWRSFSSYPPHTVVGLPTLSPTMATGNIAKWLKKEGDSISPGDAIAEIETDKTTVTFEALDDAFVAKILVNEGVDIPVGVPIMVTVEESSDVSKFVDFKAEASAPVAKPAPPKPSSPAPPTPSPAQAPVQPAPIEVPKVVKIDVVVAAPITAAAPVAKAPATPVASPSAAGVFSVVWGTGVSKSGLAAKLAADQQAYITKYGSTGHIPLKL